MFYYRIIILLYHYISISFYYSSKRNIGCRMVRLSRKRQVLQSANAYGNAMSKGPKRLRGSACSRPPPRPVRGPPLRATTQITASWPCDWPVKTSLYRNSPLPKGFGGQKRRGIRSTAETQGTDCKQQATSSLRRLHVQHERKQRLLGAPLWRCKSAHPPATRQQHSAA